MVSPVGKDSSESPPDLVDVLRERKMEDMSKDQLWECAEQGVYPMVQILTKYFNWSMKEQ